VNKVLTVSDDNYKNSFIVRVVEYLPLGSHVVKLTIKQSNGWTNYYHYNFIGTKMFARIHGDLNTRIDATIDGMDFTGAVARTVLKENLHEFMKKLLKGHYNYFLRE